MMAKTNRNTSKRWLIWGRKLGVFACLLALALALFGHIDAPEAASVDANVAVMMLTHADGPAEHGSSAALQHCNYHTQCSFHVLLPLLPSVTILDARGVRASRDHLRDSLAFTPLGPPPKFSFLL